MKKLIKLLLMVIVVIIVVLFVLTSCGRDDPPIREELEISPQKYLKTNKYVAGLREDFLREGRVTPGFMPNEINADQTVNYLYWYSCYLFGDPDYAISVTVQFPDDAAMLKEKDRIANLYGFTEIESEEGIIICGRDLQKKLEGYFEDPVDDGSMYNIEYAIISKENRTITYSELYIWELHRVQEKLYLQLSYIYGLNKGNASVSQSDER